jgi:aromatic ring-cleaving dioxygenase
LAFRPDLFGELVPWLMQHRDDLNVLVHPITDDELRDHRDWSLWLGQSRPLDLSAFADE